MTTFIINFEGIGNWVDPRKQGKRIDTRITEREGDCIFSNSLVS